MSGDECFAGSWAIVHCDFIVLKHGVDDIDLLLVWLSVQAFGDESYGVSAPFSALEVSVSVALPSDIARVFRAGCPMPPHAFTQCLLSVHPHFPSASTAFGICGCRLAFAPLALLFGLCLMVFMYHIKSSGVILDVSVVPAGLGMTGEGLGMPEWTPGMTGLDRSV